MVNRIIYSIAVLSFFMQCTPVQKNQVKSIEWKIAANLPAADGADKALGLAGPVAGIHKEVLIIGGGANFPGAMPWTGGAKKYYDAGYVYKIEMDSFFFLDSFKLPMAIAYAAVCTTPAGIIYAGGESDNGLSDKVQMIQWDDDNNSAIFSNLPDLPFAVTNASIAFYNNNVYLAGGERMDDVSDRFLKLELDNLPAGWSEMQPIPKPLSHAVMVVQANGNEQSVYVLGGRKRIPGSTSELYSSNFSYDFKANKWKENNSMPYAMSAGTGMAVGDHSILLFGGDKGETFHKTEELIAAINNENNAAIKEELIKNKTIVQSTHPGFSKEILLYNAMANEWTMVDSIPFDVPVTTVAIQHKNKIIIPSGEIKSGVRTPQILVGSIDFK